jgi:hypothetical protein
MDRTAVHTESDGVTNDTDGIANSTDERQKAGGSEVFDTGNGEEDRLMDAMET